MVAPPSRFSTATITALGEVITGGSGGYRAAPPIGIYRSGPVLERFFGNLNIELQIGGGSRVPSVLAVLDNENKRPDGRATITRVIEAVVDPRDYFEHPASLEAVVEHMNQRLTLDGYELREVAGRHRVVALGTNTVAAAALTAKAKALDLESVTIDFERALAKADPDPASAITAACSTVESVCKCLLDEMGKPYPTNKDIKGLVTEVAKHLNLSPGRTDLPREWQQDIRSILSGLFTIVGGIGSLRPHAGDAHGKGKNPIAVDARIARLAIHAASTVSLF